ncbi:MAG: hypothetical protein ABI548_28515 [Polyangiaceae bacterium]
MGVKKRRFNLALAPHALRARTSFLVARLATLLRRRCAERLRELNITVQHYAVLCCLQDFGRCCNSDLVRWTGIDASDLIPILNALESRMCVGRDRKDSDQRQAELSLSHFGRELRARAERALEEAEDEAFLALASDERVALRDLLARVVDGDG